MTNSKCKIMVIAGEVSGDVYGADLIKEMKKSHIDMELVGIGGKKMEKAGLKLLYDSSGWGAIGLIEALKRVPKLYFIYSKIKKFIKEYRPHILVLIDFPGFNMRLVRVAKRLNIPTLYYFPPTKWAQSPKEVKDAASIITKVAATFGNTERIYREAGADVTFVGHPLLDIVKPTTPFNEIIKRFGLIEEGYRVGLLPGSREREVKDLLPFLMEMAEVLLKRLEKVQFLVPLTVSTYEIIRNEPLFQKFKLWAGNYNVKVIVGCTYDVLQVCHGIVVASGTATLEAAILSIPMVIIYKVSLLTEIIAKVTKKLPPHIGLPNLIAGKMVVPEFIQRDLVADKVANEIFSILIDKNKNAHMKNELVKVREKLQNPGANRKVVELILELLDKKKNKKII